MTIVKHHPDLGELITIAAQRKRNALRKVEALYFAIYFDEYMLDRWYRFTHVLYKPKSFKKSNSPNHIGKSILLRTSCLARMLLGIKPVRYLRGMVITLAIMSLTFPLTDSLSKGKAAEITPYMDYFVDIYFITESLVRFYTIPVLLDTYKPPNLIKVSNFEFWSTCGIIEFFIATASLSLGYEYNYWGYWIHLIRLLFISSIYIINLPEIVVLVVSEFMNIITIKIDR